MNRSEPNDLMDEQDGPGGTQPSFQARPFFATEPFPSEGPNCLIFGSLAHSVCEKP